MHMDPCRSALAESSLQEVQERVAVVAVPPVQEWT